MTVTKLLSNGGVLIGSRALDVETDNSDYDIVISYEDVNKLVEEVSKYDFLNNGLDVIREYGEEEERAELDATYKDYAYSSIVSINNLHNHNVPISAKIKHKTTSYTTVAMEVTIHNTIEVRAMLTMHDSNINKYKIKEEWNNIVELMLYYDNVGNKVNLFIFDTSDDRTIIDRYKNIITIMKALDKEELMDKETRIKLFKTLKRLNKLM